MHVDSTYTTPHELSPGQSGVFDLLILDGDEMQGLARRFWVDARDY